MKKSISGFSKMSKRRKLHWIVENFFKDPENVMRELKSYWHSNEEQQNSFIEQSRNDQWRIKFVQFFIHTCFEFMNSRSWSFGIYLEIIHMSKNVIGTCLMILGTCFLLAMNSYPDFPYWAWLAFICYFISVLVFAKKGKDNKMWKNYNDIHFTILKLVHLSKVWS